MPIVVKKKKLKLRVRDVVLSIKFTSWREIYEMNAVQTVVRLMCGSHILTISIVLRLSSPSSFQPAHYTDT